MEEQSRKTSLLQQLSMTNKLLLELQQDSVAYLQSYVKERDHLRAILAQYGITCVKDKEVLSYIQKKRLSLYIKEYKKAKQAYDKNEAKIRRVIEFRTNLLMTIQRDGSL